MGIKESKNLKYDKLPWLSSEGYEKFEPKKGLLKDFSQVDDKLILYFKNRSQAVIRAVNIEGGREIDLIAARLNELLGRDYEEILNIDF